MAALKRQQEEKLAAEAKKKEEASYPQLDLIRAPYAVYGGKCIDLVSLAPISGRAGGQNETPENDRN